jgi:quinohemoprotein ethanol dehydrogenase
MRLAIIGSLALLPVILHAQVQTGSPAQSTTAHGVERAAAGEWPQNGREYSNQRYSPLRQITAGNVAQLAPRALFQLQMAHPNSGAEATPIVVAGRVYVSTDYDVVTAFDVRSTDRSHSCLPKLSGS